MSAYQLVAAGYFGARAIEWAESGKVWIAVIYACAALSLFHYGRKENRHVG
jgi:hypothetical protein